MRWVAPCGSYILNPFPELAAFTRGHSGSRRIGGVARQDGILGMDGGELTDGPRV